MNFYQKLISQRYPYIIAEIGANHNGDKKLGKKLIKSAKETGVDAVKFQSWSKSTIFNKSVYEKQSDFVDDNFGTLEEMVEKFSLDEQDHWDYYEIATEMGLEFCSTPFSFQEVDLLMELDVAFIKVASMDLNNLEFLKYIGDTNKPIILSTGMGTLSEVDTALDAIAKTGNEKIIILHCVAVYPPEDSIVNLKNIPMLKDTFGPPVGFSDHTIGTSMPLAAIALGAKVIEKHFTLDKELPGWDHAVSANPQEMATIVNEGKRIINGLGIKQRTLSEQELKQRENFRRSVVLTRNMEEGEQIKREDVDFKRPGTGIRPDEVKYVIRRFLNTSHEKDDLLQWDDLV